MIAWILALLTATEPNAPWKDTYPATATAMAESAQDEPLFAGKDGPKKTAALYVSLSWFEARHNPRAVGDHGHSFCLGQINDTNFKGLGIASGEELFDVRKCLHAVNRMVRTSFRVCARAELEDRLSWYAGGGDGCRVNMKSKHRMRKALWLVATYPMAPEAERDALLVLPGH